ncbi:MAG TPA: lysylphosphatidylglycerol synthase transmembrane domain-containing protein [Dehalococcoidia bacterium]|jgi:uncharacterized membrane protein YbhN (UPF0104 family)|nr:lysylphosphatidylglycerol synthase transmembrane domain-containing protein [Dehalococcoidia bacterium]
MRPGWKFFALQALIPAAVIALLLWRVNLGELRDTIRGADPWWLAVAFPLFLASNGLGALRSSMSVRSLGRVPWAPLFETYLVAYMVNSLVPLRIGDVLRIQVMSNRYGLRRAGVMSAVFVTETLLDGAAFTLLFLWTLAFFGVPGVIVSIAWTFSALLLIGVILAAIFARVELRDGWEERGLVRILPPRLRGPLGRLVPEALGGLAILAEARLALRAFGLTLLGWTMQAVMYWAFGRAVGVQLSLADAVLVMIAGAMIMSVHFVPTSIGIYEGTITGVLAAVGLSGGEALAYALSTHLLLIAFGLASGAVSMWRLRLSAHDLFVLSRTRLEAPSVDARVEVG